MNRKRHVTLTLESVAAVAQARELESIARASPASMTRLLESIAHHMGLADVFNLPAQLVVRTQLAARLQPLLEEARHLRPPEASRARDRAAESERVIAKARQAGVLLCLDNTHAAYDVVDLARAADTSRDFRARLFAELTALGGGSIAQSSTVQIELPSELVALHAQLVARRAPRGTGQ